MSSDTRNLLIILAVVGALCFGCLCAPFGAAFLLPAFHRARETAADEEVRQAGRELVREVSSTPPVAANPFEAASEVPTQPIAPVAPTPWPPGVPVTSVPPTGFGPGMMPPGAIPPPGWVPPPGWRPPGFDPRRIAPPTPTTSRSTGPVSSGSRSSRRTSEEITSGPGGLSESQRRSIFKAAATSKNHDELCEAQRIKKSELEQILAEGKRMNW